MTSLPSQFNSIGYRSDQRRRLASRMPSTTATVIYEVPQGMSARIVKMFLCMTQTGSTTLQLHHVRPGETAGITNALYYDLSLAAKTTTVVDETLYLSGGDKIVAAASAASHICVTLYGEET